MIPLEARPGPVSTAPAPIPDPESVPLGEALPLASPGQDTVLDLGSDSTRTVILPAARPLPVVVPNLTRKIEVKIASEPWEWDQAFTLVTETYRGRGYEAANTRGLRFTAHHALPDTTTFVARQGTRVVATLSTVQDNRLLGLPMEAIYGPEIAALRQADRRIAEVTSLADTGLVMREFVPVFVALMRHMAQFLVRQGADALVISINPRHRKFYTKVMGFVPLGGQRSYPSVRGHPAEAYLLDVPLLRHRAPEMYRQIYGHSLRHEAFAHTPMSADLARSFASRSCRTSLHEVRDILAFVGRHGSPRRW